MLARLLRRRNDGLNDALSVLALPLLGRFERLNGVGELVPMGHKRGEVDLAGRDELDRERLQPDASYTQEEVASVSVGESESERTKSKRIDRMKVGLT